MARKVSTMIPKRPRRITKQVRISLDWQKVLKVEAEIRGLTMSKFLDVISRHFFVCKLNKTDSSLKRRLSDILGKEFLRGRD